MARRRELRNVADGMTDHLIGPFDDTLVYAKHLIQLRAVSDVSLNLLTGVGSLPELLSYAETWRWDFVRHLGARHIPLEWVSAAQLTVAIVELGTSRALMRAQVWILDDLGTEHTSTRRAPIHLLTRPHEAMVSRWRTPTSRYE
ncbi:hypothetical protein [Mesorhizobium japonicum]|uniref:hypothetical protein n=1 Tax=Mesorhizobium japonicum TaxID=2066070 RepID=UPI003B5B125E